MAAWTNGTYTNKGLALLSKLTQGNSLKITRAVIGTGYVTPTSLANQTAVTGIKQNLSFMTPSYPKAGTCKLPMFLTHEGVTTAYKGRQIGIYALAPDVGEILYFIIQSSEGTEVPAESVMPEYSATWTFYFQYGQADTVNVTVDPSHAVTEDMLNEVRIIAETGVSDPKKGTAIAIKNTAELPFANLRLFGKTTQNGTPTPSNPAELVSVSPSTIYVFKRNLLPVSGESKDWNGISFTVNSDGTVTANGTATDLSYMNFETPLPKGDYHVSGCPSGGNVTNGYFVRVVSTGSGTDITEGDDTGNGFTLHLAERKTVIFRVAIRKGVTVNNLVFKPMICLESVKDGAFEKRDSQNLAINVPNGLPGIPVSSGGNYTDADGQQWICDEIDFARGVYVQRVGRRILNGTETWSKRPNNNAYIVTLDGFDGGWMDGTAISSHFKCHYHEAYNGTPGYFAVDAKGLSYFASDKTTVDEFKTWLSSNNVTVYSRLATPVETPLTSEEIAAFDALHSNNPVTTITNNGDAYMEADCFLAQHEAGFKRIINYVQRYLLSQ